MLLYSMIGCCAAVCAAVWMCVERRNPKQRYYGRSTYRHTYIHILLIQIIAHICLAVIWKARACTLYTILDVTVGFSLASRSRDKTTSVENRTLCMTFESPNSNITQQQQHQQQECVSVCVPCRNDSSTCTFLCTLISTHHGLCTNNFARG